jgi:hypothetical protein
MQDKRYIICGNAACDLPPGYADTAMRFHLHGPEDDFKVTLNIADIHRSLYRDVPHAFPRPSGNRHLHLQRRSVLVEGTEGRRHLRGQLAEAFPLRHSGSGHGLLEPAGRQDLPGRRLGFPLRRPLL